MSASKRKWAARLLCVAGIGAAAFALAASEGMRLRHLAVPVLVEPSSIAAPGAAGLEEDGAALEPVLHLGTRVAALAESDRGVLAIGLFDGGVMLWRRGEARPVAVPEIDGRRRFVTALGWSGERLFVATYAGVLELDDSGRLRGVQLDGTAVESLLVTQGRILAGTARGLFARGASGGFEEVPLTTADGEPVRPIALASAGGTLWIGTPRGVYSLAPGQPNAEWHPLVFGRPASSTNVAVAIAAVPGGAIAGTDEGGISRVRGNDVRAMRFAEGRANAVNPGAAAEVGGCAAFGTQSGVVVGSMDPQSARRFGPGLDVTAVHHGSRLFVGTAQGDVYALDPERVPCPPRAPRPG